MYVAICTELQGWKLRNAILKDPCNVIVELFGAGRGMHGYHGLGCL